MKKLLLVLMLTCAVAVHAQTIRNTSVAEADAVLIDSTGDPKSGGFKLRRGWVQLASKTSDGVDDVGDLIEELRAVDTYTNPQANGHTYTGLFVNSSVRAVDENTVGTADRAPSIIQELTKVVEPTTYTELTNLVTVIKNEDIELLNFLEFNEGENRNVFHIYRNIAPSSRSDVMNIEPIEPGYKLIKQDFKTGNDNTGVYVATFETNTWSNYSGNEPIQTNTMTEVNYDAVADEAGITWRRTKMADGLEKTAAESILANIGADNSNWFIDTSDLREQANGEYSIRWTQTRRRRTNDYITVQFVPDNGRQQETEVVIWRWLNEADANQVVADSKANEADMTAAYPAAPASHLLSSVKSDPNANGSYDVTRVTFIPNNTGTANWPEIPDRVYSNYVLLTPLRGSRGQTNQVKYRVALKLEEYFNSLDDAWENIEAPATNIWFYAQPQVSRIGDGKYKTVAWYRLEKGLVFTNFTFNGTEPIQIINEEWQNPVP